MKTRFTIEELAGVFNKTLTGVIDWTSSNNSRLINKCYRIGANFEEALLKTDKNGEVTIDEILRWDNFMHTNPSFTWVDRQMIDVLIEGDETKIKKLTEINNERLRLEKERKKVFKGR